MININNAPNVYNQEQKIIEESTINSLFPIYKEKLESIGIYDDFSVSLDFDFKSEGVEIKKMNITLTSNHKLNKKEIEEFLNIDSGFKIIVK